jgi:putative transposase
MAKIEKKTKRYPSDLTDEEWARIEPFLPRASKAGRPIEVDLREVLNAIRYMARSGGGCPQALAVAEASVRRRGL